MKLEFVNVKELIAEQGQVVVDQVVELSGPALRQQTATPPIERSATASIPDGSFMF